MSELISQLTQNYKQDQVEVNFDLFKVFKRFSKLNDKTLIKKYDEEKVQEAKMKYQVLFLVNNYKTKTPLDFVQTMDIKSMRIVEEGETRKSDIRGEISKKVWYASTLSQKEEFQTQRSMFMKNRVLTNQALNNLILTDLQISQDFKKINFQDLEFTKKIHEGFVFDVYIGKYLKVDVVIKKLKTQEDLQIQQRIQEFKRELSSTALLCYHPNIVYLHGYCVEEKQYFLVNELCE